MAYTFDCDNHLIIVSSGVTTISAVEAYSRWVDYVAANDGEELCCLPAFDVSGGDPLGSGVSITPYIFLTNGWKFQPLNTSSFEITGNLIPESGQSAFEFASGVRPETVRTLALKSETVNIAGGSGATAADVWNYGTRTLTSGAIDPASIWDYDMGDSPSGSYGDKVSKLPVGVGILGQQGKTKFEMEQEKKLVEAMENLTSKLEEEKDDESDDIEVEKEEITKDDIRAIVTVALEKQKTEIKKEIGASAEKIAAKDESDEFSEVLEKAQNMAEDEQEEIQSVIEAAMQQIEEEESDALAKILGETQDKYELRIEVERKKNTMLKNKIARMEKRLKKLK